MYFYMGEGESELTEDVIQHSATNNNLQKVEGKDMAKEELMHSDNAQALWDNFQNMSEEDQATCAAMVGLALADAGVDEDDDL